MAAHNFADPGQHVEALYDITCQDTWAIESPCRIRQAPSSEYRGLYGSAEGDGESGGMVSSLRKLSSGGLTAIATDILPVLFRELSTTTSRE